MKEEAYQPLFYFIRYTQYINNYIISLHLTKKNMNPPHYTINTIHNFRSAPTVYPLTRLYNVA